LRITHILWCNNNKIHWIYILNYSRMVIEYFLDCGQIFNFFIVIHAAATTYSLNFVRQKLRIKKRWVNEYFSAYDEDNCLVQHTSVVAWLFIIEYFQSVALRTSCCSLKNLLMKALEYFPMRFSQLIFFSFHQLAPLHLFARYLLLCVCV